MRFLFFLFLTTSIFSQQTTPKTAFLEKWNNSKEYLIKMAESMPEEQYDYRPAEDKMSFKDQIIHICGNMLWLSTTYFLDKKFDRKAYKDNPPGSKKEVIELLNTSFDKAYDAVMISKEKDLESEVDFFAGPKSKLQILNLLQDHVTHHRGQLIVYLNLNDIKPPKYVGW
ncbi:DinB family protein [Flavobacteriaceae bacterium (ex Bugula neritina AB1)]|nr:DinB family protein [Flavobacteriaceae bacterium (ex Bugula neritina AB1)]